MADSALAAIQQKPRNNNINEDDVMGGLTQSICDTLISGGASDSCENMPETTEDFMANLKTQNQFQTAKQLNMKNQAQKNNNPQSTSSSSNAYNPALQARKILGAKRRFPETATPKEPVYRDEGRDINTEFG